MHVQRIVLSMAAMAAVLITLPSSSSAGCNLIPDAAQLSATGSATEAVMATIPLGLRYRGALGRVDRAIAQPGVTNNLVLGPDPICGSAGIVDVDGSGVDKNDVVIALLFRPGGAEGSLARIFASEPVCEKIARSLSPKGPLIPVGECENRDVVFIPKPGKFAADEPREYRFHIPYPGAELVDGAGLLRLAGPAKVVVVAATEQGIATLPAVADADCAQLAEPEYSSREAYICIDRIYDDFTDRCGIGPQAQTTVPCQFQNVAPEIDFAEQCDSDPPTGSQLASCDKNPDDLTFSVDACGGAHIPFNWTRIREKTTGDKITRVVAGTSALGRKKKAAAPRILIPGREFLGSTNPNDPLGTVGNWRKPEISPWYTAENVQEFGLIGSTDKEQSIVHVYPRLEVTQLCDSFVATDEACLAVEQMSAGGVETCATNDRSGANPKCKSIQPGRFFACEGGAYEGMPCTRPLHCGLGGTCTGQPSCEKPGGVWVEGVKLKKSNNCWRDEDCTTGNKTQCGFKLFDFTDRLQGNLVTLNSKITVGAGKKQRGACGKKADTACHNSNASPKSCPLESGSCRGYVLEAKGEK